MPDVNGNTYETISKFDRGVGGLLSANNIHTKPATIFEVNNITGESETFIIQTIRISDGENAGDHVSITFVDKDGNKRLLLPPRAVNTIVRQRDALSAKQKRNSGKAAMKARILAGEDVGKALREYRKAHPSWHRGRGGRNE